MYAVQNPFLYGMYELRREQMKMQQESLEANLRTGLKEKQFFYPTTFENLEAILRNNFTSVNNLDDEQRKSSKAVKFYTESHQANDAFKGTTNPRIMILGKISVSLCQMMAEGASYPRMGLYKDSRGLTIDTLSSHDQSTFFKFNANEMYPDHVLVYRDVSGPPDAHTSRLTNFVRHCQVSYRSGTRYNLQEQEFKGSAAATAKEDPDEIKTLQEDNV